MMPYGHIDLGLLGDSWWPNDAIWPHRSGSLR